MFQLVEQADKPCVRYGSRDVRCIRKYDFVLRYFGWNESDEMAARKGLFR
jgi:hypothetical protein